MTTPPKIGTCLWFNDTGEEAATLYTSLFPNSEITSVMRYGPGMHMPEGLAMMVEFTLAGARYQALNGGPSNQLSLAVSITVAADDQAEVDRLWSALLEGGGKEMQCFWLTDRFGLSWQIVPRAFGEFTSAGDKAAVDRVMAAMFSQVKPDIAALEAAFRG